MTPPTTSSTYRAALALAYTLLVGSLVVIDVMRQPERWWTSQIQSAPLSPIRLPACEPVENPPLRDD